MDEAEHGWEPQDEWHPMFRMYHYYLRSRGDRLLPRDDGGRHMDYTEYWERQRDADGLPEVWQ